MPRPSAPAARAAAISFANAASSSGSALNPLARRIALRSHCSPNTSSRPPTTRRSVLIGNAVNAEPRIATMSANASRAAQTPNQVERQSRVTPTARTTVTASTASTAQARKRRGRGASRGSCLRPLEDLRGVARERCFGLAQGADGRGAVRRFVNVEPSDALMPALQLLQLGLLLVEFGERELLDLKLVVDLGARPGWTGRISRASRPIFGTTSTRSGTG